jgi:hypothetical protein
LHPAPPLQADRQPTPGKLEEEGIHVSLRTVQQDLEEMSGMGLFDLTSDERSKPHGWCFERHGLNDFANIMPLSLAVALKTWSDQASQLLPASVLTELNPLIDKAGQVIRDSQSELAALAGERASVTCALRRQSGDPPQHPDPRRPLAWPQVQRRDPACHQGAYCLALMTVSIRSAS